MNSSSSLQVLLRHDCLAAVATIPVMTKSVYNEPKISTYPSSLDNRSPIKASWGPLIVWGSWRSIPPLGGPAYYRDPADSNL